MKVGEVASRRILDGVRSVEARSPIFLAEPVLPQQANYVMFDLEGLPPRLDELERIYLWGMQVFGEQPGPFLAATADFGPSGDRRGWEGFLIEADAIFTRHGDIPRCKLHASHL